MSAKTIAAIAPGSVELGEIPFNLFATAPGGRIELFCRVGLPVTERHREIMQRSDRRFFVSSDEVDAYMDYAFDRLEHIVSSGEISPGDKAHIVRGVGRRLVRMLLCDPRSGEAVRRCGVYVISQVDLILSSLKAADYLFALSSAEGYTLSHSINVCTFCVLIGMNLYGRKQQILNEMALGGLLHDVGMTQIDPHVYNKPGPLNEVELAMIRTHPIISCEFLEGHGLSGNVLAMARSHHERYDGSGYPDGLTGREIHPFARIAAVADVYDAMTSNRAHRKSFSHLEALSEMSTGQAFDPVAMKALMRTVLQNEKLVEGFDMLSATKTGRESSA